MKSVVVAVVREKEGGGDLSAEEEVGPAYTRE
jgi:hypothetical protein